MLLHPQQRIGSVGDNRGQRNVDNYSLHDDRVKLSERGRTILMLLTSTTEVWDLFIDKRDQTKIDNCSAENYGCGQDSEE